MRDESGFFEMKFFDETVV